MLNPPIGKLTKFLYSGTMEIVVGIIRDAITRANTILCPLGLILDRTYPASPFESSDHVTEKTAMKAVFR